MENENMEVNTPTIEENTTPEVEQTPKKGNKKLLIILLIVIIVGVIAALVVPSLLKKDETKETKEPNKVEETLTKDSQVVKDLFKTYALKNYNNAVTTAYQMIGDDNDYIAYKSLIAFYNMERTEGTWPKSYKCKKGSVASVDYNKFKEKYKEMFNTDYSDEMLKIGESELILENNVLYQVECNDIEQDTDNLMVGTGGICSEEIEEVRQNGNSLVILTRFVLYDFEDPKKCTPGIDCQFGNQLAYNFEWNDELNRYIFVKFSDDETKEYTEEFKKVCDYEIEDEDDEEETTDDEEETVDPNAPYDFSSEITCTNKKDIAISDIYNFDETEEGVSYTEQLLKVGTYTPDKLSEEVISYYLSNSQYACEYIKYNESAKASSKEGTLLASITEDNMKKSIEKLFGSGFYKKPNYGYLLGLPNSCNMFELNPKNNNYELRIIGGCGGASAATIKVTKTDVTTSGENTIVTEYIDYSGVDDKDKIVKYKLKIEYTVKTTDKVLIKIVTTKI